MRAQTSEAVFWLISTAAGGVAILCGAAWLYEKTRRHVDHPELGRLTYHWDCWRGLKAHYDTASPAVCLEIPGGKTGPKPQDCQEFVIFWASIRDTVTGLRSYAVEEFRDMEDGFEGEPEDELMSEISRGLAENEASFDQYWQLSQVSKVAMSASQVEWTLDFEVAWDIEHTRTAYLDKLGQFLAYNLTCAGSGLDEDDDD